MDSNQYYQENRTPDVVVRNVRKLDNTVNNFHALIHQLTGIKHNEYKSFFLPNQSNSFYTVFIKCREHQAPIFSKNIERQTISKRQSDCYNQFGHRERNC